VWRPRRQQCGATAASRRRQAPSPTGHPSRAPRQPAARSTR
jgi:hypothetical protein